MAQRIQPVVFKDYEKDTRFWENYAEIMRYLNDSGYYLPPSIENWSHDEKADPKLIAMAATYNLQVITFELPTGHLNKNNPMKKEPKIPDVANAMNVGCISLFGIEDRYHLHI